MEVAKYKATANTVDFVSMYPSFEQTTLKERLMDSLQEAWSWQAQRAKDGDVVRLQTGGFVHLTPEEAARPSANTWTMDEVAELVAFVIDNGYIQRGQMVLKQVKGFGMGLACAGQIAILGYYPVERPTTPGQNCHGRSSTTTGSLMTYADWVRAI